MKLFRLLLWMVLVDPGGYPDHLLQASETCVLEVVAFNAFGVSWPVQLDSVWTVDDPKQANLLRVGVFVEFGETSKIGSRIRFPRSYLGRGIEIRASDSSGTILSERLELVDCRQRASLSIGETDSGHDVYATTVTGRLAGCSLTGLWWLRAMPMFGGFGGPVSVFEGVINPKTGDFVVSGAMRGTRHIFVLGKGREPIQAFAASIVRGGKNNLGTVKMVCRQ